MRSVRVDNWDVEISLSGHTEAFELENLHFYKGNFREVKLTPLTMPTST